jgi:preprotein translocase subunit SecF
MKQTSGTAPSRASTPAKGAQTPQRFFELIPPNLGVDYVRLSPMMTLVSVAVILIGLVSIWARGGLNYGIDFAGGTLVQVRFPQATPIADLRTALESADLRGVVVQDVGNEEREFQIRVQATTDDASSAAADAVKAGLQAKFGEGSYDVLRVESVGPKVGGQLWRDAALAIIVATIMMGAYIAFRFDLRFGMGAAVALVHDVLVTLAAISLFNVEFDLTTVAALLTIVGFSVNDTVIISDRIRENTAKMRKESLRNIVNVSINETMSRTIITNGTAIMVTLVLFLLGGEVIHSFAFTLLVGFIAGTYSSIYIASPIVLWMEGRRQKRA